MSEARVLPFPRPQIAEAQHGRFMIVSDIETLDDRLEGLPDDVVAFEYRRMVREFRLGRALDDDEAAYKLHKHASTVQRFRRQHPEFLALMDGASGHARHKFLTRKLAKSSNFRRPKPLKNCQSAEPDIDSTESLTFTGKRDSVEAQNAPVAAPCLEASTAPAREESHPSRRRTPPAAPGPTRMPEDWQPDDPEIGEYRDTTALWKQARAEALRRGELSDDWPAWWRWQRIRAKCGGN